ncbi:DUF2163 domain-containing protein [Amphiplicatus metriothermophilus]|uniref:Bacteriophage phiJL001 Gp84 C-terminal domain-containing protein n=1 Tax=Amphiplicatus metriothermophilus TaxID=1519374 RepID=A0A239PJ27_9PROT|nr:DUF2163 domain-containing protein [Amphiplicatus metriothermophilus]MBB5518096.1 putative phage protein (TIGR02218 family) [Amphiplicatus metriothermophilus]SNT67570.1 phage conserved hypothetical protein BR0599 [Amphiplicatus metriothermophilus]
MRALDPAFEAHLKSGATTLATCWRVTRKDGAVFGFTDHDRPLTVAGETYEPQSGAHGAALAETADLAVDNSEIVGLLSSARLPSEALAAGRFDGAAVEIWRVNWSNTDERVLLKRGVIGEVARDGARFTAEIRGLAHLLDQTAGRAYQRHCDARLGDARCGVDLDQPAFRAEGVATAVRDESRFAASGLDGFADGWFVHGRLDWTGGANAGTASHVKAHAGADLSLWLPPGAGLAPGDAFVVFAGCDKAFATCRAKFSNAVNFRGFHLMPGNDFAASYPRAGERNDGGRRR